MKKILFFINTLNGGGAEKVLVDLVNALSSLKCYDIEIVSILGGVHQKNISQNVKHRNIINVNNRFIKNFLARVVFHLPVRLVYKLVSNKSYDIEIAYLEGFPTHVIAAGNSSSKKIAFIHCDVSVDNVMNKLYKNNNDCLIQYNKFDKVCFVSESAKLGFENSVGNLINSTVIHNVIDFKSIRKKSSENISYEYTTSGIKLIAVGRLAEEKGNERLVNVFSELSKDYPIELWILGDGDRRSAIEDIIKTKRLKNISLMGFQSNPYAFMNKADLLVCPSFYEGYSTVVAEALALGLPVLTTDCAGMIEILENGKYGMIVENSEEGLKSGLIEFIEDKNLYNNLKNAVANKMKKNNSVENVKMYDELFCEIL